MTDITYTQQFYLCAVNSKGKFPWGNEAASRCLLAGATLELLDSGVITLDVEGTLGVACAWGDWTVSRPLGGAAAYEVLTDVAVEPAATGEPGAYLQPLYDTIAGFAKPTGLDGLAQVYLYGLDTDPQALLVQYIGASLWEMECADAVPGDNPAKQRYAPRGDATLTVVGKIRAEVLEADAPAVGPLTLAYLLNRAGIARDCVGKPDAARLKARLEEVRRGAPTSPTRAALDRIDRVVVGMHPGSVRVTSLTRELIDAVDHTRVPTYA